MLTSIVLASGNAGKIKEFAALFQPYGISLIPQASLNISDAPEPHPSFVENALTKARHASALSGLPSIADDSGLCVLALGGAPGILSARYAQTTQGERSDLANNQKLVRELANITDRKAWYVAVLVFLKHAEDPQPLIAEASWYGEIIDAPRGTHGFGYDPYFFIPEQGCTVAQLDPTLKNRIGHRGQAMQLLFSKMQRSTNFLSF
jgi:XTP/dITP diphosphohydrolase